MADLDRDLSNRLARLADAVPVASRHLDPVHRTAVATRQQVRLAWATPLVVLAIGAVIVGLAKIGSTGPGASATPGGVVATDVKGAFSLTIQSSKAVYRPDEPIEVHANLAYAGPGASVRITHGLGVDQGPLGFGVVEPVNVPDMGWVQLDSIYEDACTSSTLERDAPLEKPFAKGGGPLLNDPNAPGLDKLQAYMSDPVLRLPPGTWHVFAVAQFTTAGCSAGDADSYQLRAEIPIVVGNDPQAPTPSATASAVSDAASSGPYTLELSADRAVYHESDPIQITGTFTYSGTDPIAVQGFIPWEFSIAEPVYGMHVSELIASVCNHDVLQPGQRLQHAFVKGGGVSGSDPQASFTLGWISDPVLHLPPGTWHVRASSSLTEGTCGAKTISLGTEIAIQVLPDP